MKRHARDAPATVKLDAINRQILATVHKEANISNAELAARIGRSEAACSQRVLALRKAGYFIAFTAEVDLGRMCQHVIAYVEFTLTRNDPASRVMFVDAISQIPEFMDCVRVTGDTDYISFTCCSSVADLSRLCDQLSAASKAGIKRISTRIVLERPKWFFGYPLEKLAWLDT